MRAFDQVAIQLSTYFTILFEYNKLLDNVPTINPLRTKGSLHFQNYEDIL